MKRHFLTLLVTLCALLEGLSAHAQSAGMVGVWGLSDPVPAAAQSGVTAIAAGAHHTVVLKSDGTVVAWGYNCCGPVTPPVGLSGVTAIAAGGSGNGSHTLALKSDGSVVAWGINEFGETTVPVAAQSGVTAIAAGFYHSMALKSDGSVVAWGGGHGQSVVPVEAQSGVMAIAGGCFHSVALKSNGLVVTWGYGQTPVPVSAQSGVVAIAAGGDSFGRGHNVALKNDGTVVAWGYNGNGQTTVPAGLTGVTAIAAGGPHTVALKSNGTVVAWGENGYGQATVPPGLSGVTAIAGGAYHTVVIVVPTVPIVTAQPVSQTIGLWQTASFTVAATGFPLSYHWRKDGVPLYAANSSTYFQRLAHFHHAGTYTVVASNSAGSVTSSPAARLTVTEASPVTLVAWGDNYSTPIAAQSGVTAIAAGGSGFAYGHSVALKNDGSVVAWGWNGWGQATVPAAAQSGVTAIAAGASHSVAVKNGAVLAWGDNGSGQTTVPVAAQSGVATVAAGWSHTIALKFNGGVVAWGANGGGQTTVPVAAESGVTAIAGGRSHTVALKTDGSVLAWGDNSYGQTTVPVAAQSGVTAIAAGEGHSVALKNDGTVVAWGLNNEGQTSALAGLTGVTAIAAGGYRTVGLMNDGTVAGQSWPPAGMGGVTAIAAGAVHTVALLSPTRVQFSSPDVSVAENVGAASLTIRRVGDLAGTHTVDFATQDGSAAAGVDYTAQSGTLRFAPGQFTQTVSILIANDGVPEGSKSFRVLLSGLTGSGALLGLPMTNTVTILDNDPGFQFGAARYSVWETSGVATITVLRGNDLNSAVAVDYATSNGTATAEADYSSRSGTLQFAAGEITKTIIIPILDDGLNEGSETLNVTLTDPGAGVSLGANRHAVLAILDDERPLNIGQSQIKTIAAGLDHTLALKSDGSLWAWGNDVWGQLGDGASATNRTERVRVGMDNDWIAVEAGELHSVGLKADGSLWAWGYNGNGQLGDGTRVNRNRPVRIGARNDWLAVSAGYYRTLALKTDGSLWIWGYGWSEAGPARVDASTDWTSIALAVNGFAVTTDGSLWALPNSYGMLPAPEPFGADNNWITVTAGGNEDWDVTQHVLALKTDGSLFAWGHNWSGQLGTGANDPGTNVPVPVNSDNDWSFITAGGYHSAALKSDGSLWTWGANSQGQLGDGTWSDTNRPALANSDNDWVVVEAGSYHTLGLRSDGSLWTWGWNGSGQLGIGTMESTNIPVRLGMDHDWAVPAWAASEFRFINQGVGDDGRFRISFTHTNSRSYFILYRGTDVTHILEPVDATLGPFVFQLSDPTPVSSNATAFYRIRAVPLVQAFDLDGDGIDDGYELRYRTFLNPTNPADAALDFDGDGRSNLQEYYDGTDPAVPPQIP